MVKDTTQKSDAVEEWLTAILRRCPEHEEVLELRVLLQKTHSRVIAVESKNRRELSLELPDQKISDEGFENFFARGGVRLQKWFVQGSLNHQGRHLLFVPFYLDEDVGLSDLLSEGAFPSSVDVDALQLARVGQGVCVFGPHAAYNERVVSAFANALNESFCVERLHRGQGLKAIAITSEVVAASRLSPEAFLKARAMRPEVIWLVSVLTSNIAQLHAVPGFVETTPHLLYFAAPIKTPMLIERHSYKAKISLPKSPMPFKKVKSAPIAAPKTANIEAQMAPASLPSELPPIPELGEAPPADWAVDDADRDIPKVISAEDNPSSLISPEDSSRFSDVLSAVKERPSYKPIKPHKHPQTQSLIDSAAKEDETTGDAIQSDPFGGLTFGAPPHKDDP